MLGSSDASFRCLVESFPHILSLPLDTHLKPMMELLESIGIPKERMHAIFLLFPPILLCDSKDIERKVLSLKKVNSQILINCFYLFFYSSVWCACGVHSYFFVVIFLTCGITHTSFFSLLQ